MVFIGYFMQMSEAEEFWVCFAAHHFCHHPPAGFYFSSLLLTHLHPWHCASILVLPAPDDSSLLAVVLVPSGSCLWLWVQFSQRISGWLTVTMCLFWCSAGSCFGFPTPSSRFLMIFQPPMEGEEGDMGC